MTTGKMADPQNQRPLQDTKVLVTRPRQRAAGLQQKIEEAGGTALLFPAIEISEPSDGSGREYVRDHMAEFSLAIFISPTAVEKTLAFIKEIPAGIRLAAIGSRTASTAESMGRRIDIMPDGHDTEALLEHTALQPAQIAGARIVIFRGEGGRELLGDTLQARGAEIVYADMYRREPPASAGPLVQYLKDADAITVSSNEGLQNLYELAPDKADLVRHVLVVPGKRAFALAKKLGFSKIFEADNATDDAVVDALKYAKSKLSQKP